MPCLVVEIAAIGPLSAFGNVGKLNTSLLGTQTTHQIFFRKRRFSGGDVCGVQPSECRVLTIQNGPTQLGDWALSYLSIREKFILRFMTGESWCAT